MRKKSTILYLLFMLMGTLFNCGNKNTDISVIPFPKDVRMHSGHLLLSSKVKISMNSATLNPLSSILIEEIYMLTGITLNQNSKSEVKNNIHLSLENELDNEEYCLVVDDSVVIEGGSYRAVAMGTVTFLQLLKVKNGKITIPKCTINDKPRSSYRGLLIDLARQWHDVKTLEQIIIMCRWYKINYLQMHLNDDQSFTFPSKAFPKLATPGRHYTIEELRGLVQFAENRGVTLVPEFDGPGHSTAMRKAMPELFGDPDLYVIDLSNDKVYPALATLVQEICEVFKPSPFFHIGADEAWLGKLAQKPQTEKAVKRRGLDEVHDLFLEYIARMDKNVKKNGKTTLMWESFKGTGSEKVFIPKDIIVMAWETIYELPQNLLNNGYTIINASWRPTYITPGNRWDPDYIYNWNIFRWENWYNRAPSYTAIQLEPTDQIIGGQMCAWEMTQEMEIPSIRVRLPALSEKIYIPDSNLTYDNYQKRWLETDVKLQKLIQPVIVKAEGLSFPDYVGPVYNKENWFGEKAILAFEPTLENMKIRFTLDGSVPSKESELYKKPFVIESTVTVKAKVFDEHEKELGYLFWRNYEHRPISALEKGILQTIRHDRIYQPRTKFGNEMVVELKSAMKDGSIRYTLDGTPPTIESAEYKNPIKSDSSVTIRAQLFGKNNKLLGMEFRRDYRKIDFQENLTTGKPVSVSNFHGGHPPDNIVDGAVDLDNYWDSGSEGKQWVMIDLEKNIDISTVHIFPFWDGKRYYQYTVDVSENKNDWKQIVDYSNNQQIATSQGHLHSFDQINVRYLRINMLYNSVNPMMHLVEVRAYK